ncbi:MAG: ROK family protein, partial [Thermofilaceae archaeon]
ARSIIENSRGLLYAHGVSERELMGVGVGSIGPLDMRKGILIKPANLPVENVLIVEPIKSEFGAPTYLVNDCVAAVIGEKHFGLGRGYDDLVYVTISTGIGGGVYANGNLLLGKDGNAHEIGHMVVDEEGKIICGCGKKGHWEAYSSGSGIPKLAQLIAAKEQSRYEDSKLYRLSMSDPSLSSKDIYDAAKSGDAFALKVVEEAGRYNAIGIANVVNVYDPSLITVGGSVALNNVELVLEPIIRMTPNYAINRMPRIEITPLGDDAGLYGAVALALGLEKYFLK